MVTDFVANRRKLTYSTIILCADGLEDRKIDARVNFADDLVRLTKIWKTLVQ